MQIAAPFSSPRAAARPRPESGGRAARRWRAGLLAALASGVHWSARPHVFTFLGTAVFAALLDGWHTGRLSRRWLWALPLAMVVWANAHGGFLIGLVLLGAYLGADALRWLASEP